METPTKTRRGRPPRLSRAQVVAAALDLVDREGVEGLTMRALAKDLGVDPMAVYRHVRDKDDLLGALCDQVLMELDPLDLDAPWEPQVRRLAAQVRERLVARPALLPALAGGPVTPASLVLARDAVELLARAGVPVPLAMAAFGAVFAYVLGFAVLEAALPAPEADARALTDGARKHLGLGPEVASPPYLDAAFELMGDPGDFELGLDLLLDGLRARLQTEAAQ